MLLSIDNKTEQLLIRNKRLAIKSQGRSLSYFPINTIDELHIDANCLVEATLVEQLISSQVDIIISTQKSDPVIVNSNNKSNYLVQAKLAWFRLVSNEQSNIAFAQLIVKAKFKRQQRTLIRLKKLLSIHHIDIESAIEKCSAAQQLSVVNRQQLLGIEGITAKYYFSALKHFIPTWAGFTKRVKRPPTDAANALFSLTYVMFTQYVTRQLLIKGFDPSMGVLHKPVDYRPSLSCDVMEWFRPQLDIWLVILLRTSMKAEYFEQPDASTGAVLLNKQGKQAFYPAWQVLKKRLTPQLNRLLGHVRYRLLKNQASNIADTIGYG